MTWEAGSSVSRADAKVKIQDMAKEQDITGAFKVFYDGRIIATPEDLPDQVDMAKVKVSAVLDQA